MSSDINIRETQAARARRILEESWAYFTPAPTLVRDGEAPQRPQDTAGYPKAA